MPFTTIEDEAERRKAEQDQADVESIQAVQTLLSVICKTTGLGFSAVARVTDEHWTALAVQDQVGFGLCPGQSLVLETTLCTESRAGRKAIVIDHASLDPVYASHPTPRLYGFESYVSVPIVLDGGDYFGNLCALHVAPCPVSQPHIVEMFEIYAQLIGEQLSRIRRVRRAESEAQQERQTGLLREQFIAVLAHDLRNPLAAFAAGLTLLRHAGTSDATRHEVLARLQRSAHRMGHLVEDLVDYARGRLGQGVELDLTRIDDLGEALSHAIAEVQEIHPDRTIVADLDIAEPVVGNRARLQQVVSNLVSNAIVHGDQAHPVQVSVRPMGGALQIAVSNKGRPIPSEMIPKLFDAFSTTGDRFSPRMGLGLFICSEIARAHGGHIAVTSDEHRTAFSVSIPKGR